MFKKMLNLGSQEFCCKLLLWSVWERCLLFLHRPAAAWEKRGCWRATGRRYFWKYLLWTRQVSFIRIVFISAIHDLFLLSFFFHVRDTFWLWVSSKCEWVSIFERFKALLEQVSSVMLVFFLFFFNKRMEMLGWGDDRKTDGWREWEERRWKAGRGRTDCIELKQTRD